MTHLVLDQFQEISPVRTVSPVGLKELRWTEAGSCVHLPGTCPLAMSAQGQDKLCNWIGTAKAWMCLGESRVQVLLSGPRGYKCTLCSQMNLAGQEVRKWLIGPSCIVKFGCYSKVEIPKRPKVITVLPGKSVSLGLFVRVLSFVCMCGWEGICFLSHIAWAPVFLFRFPSLFHSIKSQKVDHKGIL